MIVDNIAGLIRGTVVFKIDYVSVERLLNFCRDNEIILKRVRKYEDECSVTCYYRDYENIKDWCYEHNAIILAEKKKGLPVKLKRYKSRWGIFIGVILFLACIICSQFFVLDISVEGNKKVETQKILTELDKLGVSKFKFIPAIDFRIKKQQALLNMPQLSWLTINHQGSKLHVKVTERVPDVVVNDNEPCDIVATDTGLILHMEVYNGTKQTDKNYTVEKGDVLVKGEFLNKQEEVTKVHASAKVIAQVQFEKSISVNMNDIAKNYTGKKKTRYYIDLFSLKIPLFISTPIKGEYDFYSDSFKLYCFGKKLPVGILKAEYEFYNLDKSKTDKKVCRELINNEFLKYEILELPDCVILDKRDEEIIKGGIMTVKRYYTVEKNIAKPVKTE